MIFHSAQAIPCAACLAADGDQSQPVIGHRLTLSDLVVTKSNLTGYYVVGPVL